VLLGQLPGFTAGTFPIKVVVDCPEVVCERVIVERMRGRVSSRMWDTPWKVRNELWRWLAYPRIRLLFAVNGIPWGCGWHFYGIPIIQKQRDSVMRFGPGFSLRSSTRSNPLGPNHPVILCTWQASAALEIGAHFGMTGGTLCAAERIVIRNNVAVGANTTIIDTDFHPLDPQIRWLRPQGARTAPILIEDNVFIGMNCLILKGVTIGEGSVVGAGSVVTKSVPPGAIVAGNPARIVGEP
jgi:acetyltransferase-like isoleucine patch superfamily enzyme